MTCICILLYICTHKTTTKHIMTTIKVTNTPTESVKTLFTKIYGFEPLTIESNGSFYWADKVGFSLIGNFITKNGLYNGK